MSDPIPAPSSTLQDDTGYPQRLTAGEPIMGGTTVETSAMAERAPPAPSGPRGGDQDTVEPQSHPDPAGGDTVPTSAALARTPTSLSTTTTLCPTPRNTTIRPPPLGRPAPTPSPASSNPPPVPIPDVVSFFDPASAGGGGPLVRVATAHSERSARKSRSHSASSARPSLFALTRARPGPSPAPPGSIHHEEDDCLDVFDDGRSVKSVRSAKSGRTKSVRSMQSRGEDESEEDDESDEKKIKDKEYLAELKRREDEEGAGADPAVADHVYPDGGYGWVVVACCMTLAALTNGWGMSYGVWQEHYVDVTFRGQSTTAVSWIGGTQACLMGLMAFISGRMGDRFGFKRVLCVAAFMCWLGVFTASFSKALWSHILCQGAITGIGQGLAMPLFMSLPSQWFYKHRGLASGAAMGGAGLGGGFSSLIVRRLLNEVGASKTLLIMSFVNGTGMCLAIILLRTRPTSPEAGTGRGPMFNKRVLAHSEFWSIAISLIVGVMGYGGPFMFMSQYIREKFPAIDTVQATAPLTILSFCVVIGRALVGFSADRLGPLNTYILVFFFSGVVQYALWLTATSYAHACVFSALYGIVAPGFLGILPQIVVAVFGPAELASNVGLLLLFNAPGNLGGGPIGGAIYEATGTFKWTIVTMASLQTAGAFVAMWARYRASPKLLEKV